MNVLDENGIEEEDDNSLWLPFVQYEDHDDTKNSCCIKIWTHDCAAELILYSFPWHTQEDSEKVGCNHNKHSEKYSTSKWAAKESCYGKYSYSDFFLDQQSKEYWDNVLQSSRKKKVLNKRKTIWNQSYVNVLPLNRLIIKRQDALDGGINESILNGKISFFHNLEKEQVECNFNVLTSDESESEDSGDVMDECDPIYSRFAVIRNAFHTSEDGVVFHCQKELDRYKAKMAEMEGLLKSELKQIKTQHHQLRDFKSIQNSDRQETKSDTQKAPNSFTMAKRAEERKLLSEGLDSSNDHESHEEETTEKDALNSDNGRQGSASKQERKSAIFSSIHDVFSYARTGIQGMFVKTSPNTARKARTSDSESDGSDNEDTKITMTYTSSTKHSAPLLDNHDEFTRQMTSEGGLKYESSDKSVQQLSYQNLPPPLSLSSLPDKRSKS